MVEAGDSGGDCPRCDETMVLVGADGHGVIGGMCPNCDLVYPLQYHDVYLSADIQRWEPDEGNGLSDVGENGMIRKQTSGE